MDDSHLRVRLVAWQRACRAEREAEDDPGAAERVDRAFAGLLAAEATTATGAALKLRAALAVDGLGVDRALDRRSREVPARLLLSLLRDLETMALDEAGRSPNEAETSDFGFASIRPTRTRDA